MPLSEREQQILDELERELTGGRRPASSAAPGSREPFLGLKAGVLLIVLGVLMLVWFFANPFLLVGVAAFGLMVAGIVLGASSIRSRIGRSGPPARRVADLVGGWERRLRRDRDTD